MDANITSDEQARTNGPRYRHYLPGLYPNPAVGEPRWGFPLPPIGDEREITIIGPAPSGGNYRVPIRSEVVNPDDATLDAAWVRWGGAGHAQYILAEAFSSNLDPETRDILFAHDRDRPSAHPLGSFARLDEYIQLHTTDSTAETVVWNSFRSALDRIPGGSIVNWQFYMCEHAISMFRDELRARGVHQTFHAHDPIPDSLHLSAWGRKFLAGLSELDVVYVHTDRYGRNLERSLCSAGLPVPSIKRFDLGIDTQLFDPSRQTITAANYEQRIPGIRTSLTPRQQRFIDEVLRAAEIGEDGHPRVMHRFISCDRLVPMKGSPSMFDGIDGFLQSRLASGATFEDLKRNFRFFLVEDRGALYARKPERFDQDLQSADLSDRFSVHAFRKLRQLEEKYPGIVVTTDFFYGAGRNLLPLLMRGCHTITGGASEGFNLAVAEAAFANQDLDTTIVAGNNAGIAIRLDEVGLADQAFFPQPGRAESFAAQFRAVVDKKMNHPGALGAMKQRIVAYLSTRKDSVFTGGEELITKHSPASGQPVP